jgi:hypothetical protein
MQPAFSEMALAHSHIGLSLAAMFAGVWLSYRLVAQRPSQTSTGIFLLTNILTSVTGFLFHAKAFGPAHILGVLALASLLLMFVAMIGEWKGFKLRRTFVGTFLFAFFLNVFAGLVAAF